MDDFILFSEKEEEEEEEIDEFDEVYCVLQCAFDDKVEQFCLLIKIAMFKVQQVVYLFYC